MSNEKLDDMPIDVLDAVARYGSAAAHGRNSEIGGLRDELAAVILEVRGALTHHRAKARKAALEEAAKAIEAFANGQLDYYQNGGEAMQAAGIVRALAAKEQPK